MSNSIKFAPPYTIADYRLWKGDWELWNGIAIAMTPSPFGRHQALVASLLTAFRVLIADPDAKTIQQLTLSSDGTYEPTDAASEIRVTVCGDCEIAVESEKIFSA